WASTCPTGAALVEMTLPLRKLVVDEHNVRRNNLAQGKLPRYETARRMATMQWSPQMAPLAELNVKQCLMKHDACHNTPKFRASGQNLAIFKYSGASSSRTNQQLITSAITMWWNERVNANQAVMASYPATWTGGDIGHFTVMARQNNYAVACAAARYVVSGENYFLIACNYATTNVVGKATYNVGKTAAGCTTGTNVNYAGLCKVGEAYNV
ncbi:hypothetical protein KR093_005089, partial [Drosophila rubida]